MLPSTAQILGFFNLLVGLMLVTSVLLFVGGFVQYLVRLGTWPTYRTESVEIMQWGVSVLFTLILLLALQQFLITHIYVAVSGVALIIVLTVIWFVAKEVTSAPPAEEK